MSEEVKVVVGEDSEEEEEIESTTIKQTTNTMIDEGKNVDGEDDEEEEDEEEPQEIEGEDDEEDEDEEMEEQPMLPATSTTTTVMTTVTATPTTTTGTTTLTVITPSHVRTQSNTSNVSEGITTNTSITTNPQISDTNSESATPITPSTTGAALVEGATKKLSTFWKSFKSNVATVVTTTNQAIASTTIATGSVTTILPPSSNSTTDNGSTVQATDRASMEKSSESSHVNNANISETYEEPQPPRTPPHNANQVAQTSGSPSYSTYFSGVLNKLKSELQTSTLAEPVEKLKKALAGESTHDPKNPNQIILKITHRMKDLKHSNEQLEQTIHNKYSNTLEHINVELMRLSNGMSRTLHTMQQTQSQLKKSSENLSNLLTALETCQPVENKAGTN